MLILVFISSYFKNDIELVIDILYEILIWQFCVSAYRVNTR